MASSKGEDQFRQEYAKSLAEALQERTDAPSKESLVHDAYVALCHDDPHVDSDDACRLLANALIKEEDSHYRLSERLIEGVRQATGRRTVGPTTGGASPKEDDNNGGELVWRTGGVATAAGYAALAFTCFVKIPLRCCQSSDIDVSRDFLGSYRGPKRRQEGSASLDSKMRFDDERRVNEVTQRLSAMGHHDSDNSSSDKKDDEISLEAEVWAAESDPSDFEYESSYYDQQQQALKELEQWTEAFSPVALSKPPPSTDWVDLRQGVANLLSELSYSKLAPLSQQQWSSLRVSDLLCQLTLTLLIQPENASTALLDDELQQLGIQPLFVLRDRVAASHNSGVVLGEYLTLVQTLVAVDAAAPVGGTTLAPATMVGLGALSALCHVTHTHGGSNSDNTPQQRIRQCVLETSEDLAHVMEKSRNSGDPSTIHHVMWTLLPILDRLTNVRPDGNIGESSSSCSLTKDDTQLLLQSGMFRELILIIITKEESAAKTQLLRSLQIMCVQSPSLLGKYAWRVSDLAKMVQTNEFAQEHVVDGLVWNLLGTSSLADGGAVRLRLKNMPIVTEDICRERIVTSFERLCKDAEKSLNVIDSLRITGKDAPEDDGRWKEPIQELSRFSNYLVSCPSLALLWRNAATMDDVALKRVNSAVVSLQKVLSSLARVPESSPLGKTEKSADNDKAGDPLERPPRAYGEHEEACIRKAIKILSVSSWQSPSSRQGREILSSKTD